MKTPAKVKPEPHSPTKPTSLSENTTKIPEEASDQIKQLPPELLKILVGVVQDLESLRGVVLGHARDVSGLESTFSSIEEDFEVTEGRLQTVSSQLGNPVTDAELNAPDL